MKNVIIGILIFMVCVFVVISITTIDKKNTWKWEMLQSENPKNQIYEAVSSQGRITIFSPKDNLNLVVELAIIESKAFGRVYRNLLILENREMICDKDTLLMLDKLLEQNAFSERCGCPEYIKKEIENATFLEMKRISWMLPPQRF